jgi:hypothetical protein
LQAIQAGNSGENERGQSSVESATGRSRLHHYISRLTSDKVIIAALAWFLNNQMKNQTTFKPDAAQVFISRLDKVRPIGQDRFNACCPAHGDKNPSMTVTIADDRLLTHCFSHQCSHEDILKSVGMTIGDFYEDRWDSAERSALAQPVKLRPVSEREIDLKVIEIARRAMANGEKLSLEDKARVSLAIERVSK